MIEVLPISMTLINWPMVKQLKSIRALDDNRIKPNTMAAYVQAIGFSYQSNVAPSYFLKQSQLLGHVSMGFLITCENHCDFIVASGISCTHGTNEQRVYTATIREWKHIVANCSLTTQKQEIREIANRIFEFIEQAGFRDIWSDQTKESIKDGTFILCKRS